MPPTWGAPWPNPPPLMGAPGMRRGAECVQRRVSGCAITARGWCPYAITSSSQPRALHAMGCNDGTQLMQALSLWWQACRRQDLTQSQFSSVNQTLYLSGRAGLAEGLSKVGRGVQRA